MKVQPCVYITRDLLEKQRILAFLESVGLCAFGSRLLLGEYGIYVELDDEYGTAELDAKDITERIEKFTKGRIDD